MPPNPKYPIDFVLLDKRIERRKELIRQSWTIVEKRLGPHAAALFYAKLFQQYPETEILFADTNMKIQQQKLYEVLMVAVRSLEDWNNIAPVLRELGDRHRRYGVEPEHYKAIIAVFVEVMNDYLLTGSIKSQLGLDDSATIFALDVTDAWSWILNLIGDVMTRQIDV